LPADVAIFRDLRNAAHAREIEILETPATFIPRAGSSETRARARRNRGIKKPDSAPTRASTRASQLSVRSPSRDPGGINFAVRQRAIRERIRG
jgi:hypothetical protein